MKLLKKCLAGGGTAENIINQLYEEKGKVKITRLEVCSSVGNITLLYNNYEILAQGNAWEKMQIGDDGYLKLESKDGLDISSISFLEKDLDRVVSSSKNEPSLAKDLLSKGVLYLENPYIYVKITFEIIDF